MAWLIKSDEVKLPEIERYKVRPREVSPERVQIAPQISSELGAIYKRFMTSLEKIRNAYQQVENFKEQLFNSPEFKRNKTIAEHAYEEIKKQLKDMEGQAVKIGDEVLAYVNKVENTKIKPSAKKQLDHILEKYVEIQKELADWIEENTQEIQKEVEKLVTFPLRGSKKEASIIDKIKDFWNKLKDWGKKFLDLFRKKEEIREEVDRALEEAKVEASVQKKAQFKAIETAQVNELKTTLSDIKNSIDKILGVLDSLKEIGT